MSYDFTIATHDEPSREHVVAWATEKGLIVVGDESSDSLVIEKASGRGDLFVCQIDGPFAAVPEDFDDELAAACLAPKWMMQISLPNSSPKTRLAHARSLARELAERNHGAAFDPQEEGLVWPRGTVKRVAPRAREEVIDVIGLEWFLPPQRWETAPELLLRAIRRHCPEVLPTRYGDYEPPPHRFDRGKPEEFVRFILGPDSRGAFWYASRPSFGGSCFGPDEARVTSPEEESVRIGHLKIELDGQVIENDHRWLETTVDLFSTVAVETGAFFAAAQVETGWVTRNNRLWMDAGTDDGDYFLRGMLWQGLPPFPLWLSWFGGPYEDLVGDRLTHEAVAQHVGVESERGRGLRRIVRRSKPLSAATPLITRKGGGLLVRLSTEPRPRDLLPGLPLPSELTYRARPRYVTGSNGGRLFNPAQPDDRAEVIPFLG